MRMILLISFLSVSASLGAQWDQYFAQWEGKSGSMMVDMGYMDSIRHVELPYLLAVGYQFTPCSKEGFPDSMNYEKLIKLSDKLYNYMDIQATCQIVGTFTHDCKRVDYYYLKDSIGIRGFLNNYFSRDNSGLEPIVAISHDPQSKYYREVIYPDVYITEYKANSEFIQELLNQGDNIKKGRRINHWAYFDTDIERDRYRLIVLERGFKEEESGFHRGHQRPYFYHFSRRDKPSRDYMTELTVNLQNEAKSLNGLYGGWECEVVVE